MNARKGMGWLMALIAVLIIAGCGGGGGGSTTFRLTGSVKDGNGNNLDGVTITAGTATTTSANGTYTLDAAPGTGVRVQASLTGYASTMDVVTGTAGQAVEVDFALRQLEDIALTNMDTTQTTATDSRGAEVIFPAGSVVDGDGNPVATATVAISTALPTDGDYAAIFPGLFLGILNANQVPIESFGIVTVEITSGGEACSLATGQTATLAIPVAAGADPGTATIPLWSLDEATGIWTHEGDATRDASGSPVVYRAQVSHFSTYNLDRPIEGNKPLVVTVLNGTTPAAGAVVNVVIRNNTDNGLWEGRGVTGADGTCTFPQIANGSASATAVFGALRGTAAWYTDTGTQYEMQIVLYTVVSKTITVVRHDTGDPVPGAAVSIMVEGGAGHQYINVTTNANGQVTVMLPSGTGFFYGYTVTATIENVGYSANGNVDNVAAFPTTIEIRATPQQY